VTTLHRVVASLLMVGVFVTSTGAPAGAAPRQDTEPAARVLVFSIPGVTWADLRDHNLPTLARLLDGSALAGLAPRSVAPRSGPGDAYLTISGGSRAATVRPIDGQVLALDDTSSGSDVGDIYARQTGNSADGPFVSLAWPSLLRANANEPFDTEIGALSDALQSEGRHVAAIGNADGLDGLGDSYERQAGLALADPTGIVPAGALGKNLLADDASQPFGVRLDPSVVVEQFRAEWDASSASGGVVLIEASDLARTLRYRPFVDDDRYLTLWDEALAQSDALLGQVLTNVDLDRDTVLLVAPYNGLGDRDLTAVALHRPDHGAGYLRSASTQRTGFLTLVDIAPTILAAADVARPAAMEGRPAVSEPSSEELTERVDRLIRNNDASRFREQLLTPTTTVIVLVFASVLALTIAAHVNRWGSRSRRIIAFVALINLSMLPASYLVRALPLERIGIGFSWMALLVVSVLAPTASHLVARRFGATPTATRAPLMAVLALMAIVLIGDVVTGSNLSLSAAFGYSATGNSRLYGISNYSYGQLAAATCLLAAWFAAIVPGRRGRFGGLAVMVTTLVVLGVPIWGSDVGGVLAFTPAVAAYWVRITGRRIQWRTIALGGGATIAAIVTFGLLDLTRAPDSRGHLGRLFERIGDEGVTPLVSIAERKLVANLQVSTSSLWVLAIPLGLAFWVFLRRYPDRPASAVAASFPPLSAGLAAVGVAALLGSALNDSGAIIGGIMAMVVATSLAVLLLAGPPPSAEVRDQGPQPR